MLLLARIGVGVGEAGASPPSHSLISDYFPVETRATALSIYALRHPVRLHGGQFCRWLGCRSTGLAADVHSRRRTRHRRCHADLVHPARTTARHGRSAAWSETGTTKVSGRRPVCPQCRRSALAAMAAGILPAPVLCRRITRLRRLRRRHLERTLSHSLARNAGIGRGLHGSPSSTASAPSAPSWAATCRTNSLTAMTTGAGICGCRDTPPS